MSKLTVITDANGNILGSVRSDPIKTDTGTLQFVKRESPGVTYHELDVPEHKLGQPAEKLHEHLSNELKRLGVAAR